MGTPTPEKPLDPTVRMRAIPRPPAPTQTPTQTPSALRYAAMKVPEVTILFWVVKLLTTAMGESTSDYLVYHINPYLAVGLGAVGLAVALALQLFVRRYTAWVYWLAVLMVAIFGTMGADVLHIVLGVSYLHSSIFFASALAVIFASWYAVEKTLSIHSIFTPRRELFYWATVMTTFALGTALGDLMAVTARLGYLGAGILFIVLFAMPALAYKLLGLNAIAAFWWAYVLTRPLGASFADWFGKPTSITGLGFGDGPVCLVLSILIVGFVAYLAITRIDVQKATN
jgi:uncharacterized membrane-anchored protein